MTLLKICGLTRRSDVELVDRVADYAGFIVDPETKSPRRTTPDLARDLASVLGRAKPVAVFDSYDPARAVDLAARYDFPVAQMPQIFGADVEDSARRRGVALAPVVLFGRDDVLRRAAQLAGGRYEYVLVDAVKGSGAVYSYGLRLPLELIEAVSTLGRVAVAGGITPDNVEHVLKFKPYMVDVASGVESSPGVKDGSKVYALAVKVKGVGI
ncbi:MAG: phosphoribosylanthranilate isomerase [Thermoproteus sp.]|nr:MAG: phosphoribosylanthranilate isomerase [Thermoproteus sp. CIS_19]KUO86832.1 MAG: phosphoribosylanthranilate isomerase [Thermoproteus sp. JCHS_4]MDT7869104.1 phosphoribosylanthranilate isomerase [Thermoproteus sp.]MDT7881839.1 phosphoribosylanthranilate isomerase [Thermoproteus sp.]